MKFLFLFCSNQTIDPVAPAILQQAKAYYAAISTSFVIENRPVFQTQINDHSFFFAETSNIASKLYSDIADEINLQFSDVDMIGLVNWHEGANAPEKIFCAHSTADVPSGIFGTTSGESLAAVLLAIEFERSSAGLTDFRTLFEASHWSGSMYGRPSVELLQIKAPVFDIEIGSTPNDWNHTGAQEVLVKALGRIPEYYKYDKPRALYVGGIHFESSATEIVFQSAVIEHHLPNQWLVSGEYQLPGGEMKIIAAAESCLLMPELIVYHAGLKSVYKECVRKAAELLKIPCLSHKQLRASNWKQTILQN